MTVSPQQVQDASPGSPSDSGSGSAFSSSSSHRRDSVSTFYTLRVPFRSPSFSQQRMRPRRLLVYGVAQP